jgi:hypothetical protein
MSARIAMLLALAAWFVLREPSQAGRKTASVAAKPAPACIEEPQDPYDPGLEMPFGKDVGHCVDTTEMRAPVIVAETSDTIRIANFLHGRRWWIADIPKNSLAHAFFMIAVFKDDKGTIGAAHAQIRLELAQNMPIILTEQKTGSWPEVTAISDFIADPEPYQARDTDPGTIGSFEGRVGMVTRMVSTAERVVDMVTYSSFRSVMQYELALTDRQKEALLVTAIHRAADLGYGEAYDARTNNCVTASFETLDAAVPQARSYPPFEIGVEGLLSLDTVAGPAEKDLEKRHILANGGPIPLNYETGEGLYDLPIMIAAMNPSPERTTLTQKLKAANQAAP